MEVNRTLRSKVDIWIKLHDFEASGFKISVHITGQKSKIGSHHAVNMAMSHWAPLHFVILLIFVYFKSIVRELIT